MRRTLFVILAATLALTGSVGSGCPAGATPNNEIRSSIDNEGRVSTVTIEVGPFDLHRKYRSMEGPYVSQALRVSDLVFSEKIALPEEMVIFIEPNGGKPSLPPAMNGIEDSKREPTAAAMSNSDSKQVAVQATANPADGKADAEPAISIPSGAAGKSKSPVAKPLGLIDTGATARELYWFKGLKLEVLDEDGHKLPTAEFICHLNIDVDYKLRREAFEKSDVYSSSRLMTLTQGQTEFYFPPGFAVPVASDEQWKFVFQAANRTTLQHRRVKQLCTLEFIRDSDLAKPMKALLWYNPYIAVIVDKDNGKYLESQEHDCLSRSVGESADNMVKGTDFKDAQGRMVNGHFAVPPGITTYKAPILDGRNAGFAMRDRKIHAVWSHVHPLCTSSSLIMCNGRKRRTVFSVAVTTNTSNGLEITHIDDIISQKGIKLGRGKAYELEATYENPTGMVQDSMVALGVFCHNDLFKKPDWSTCATRQSVGESNEQDGSPGSHDKRFCGIKPELH